MSDLTGGRLGQYELREVIRRGGSAVVYQGYQPSLDRLVAVKVLAFPGNPEFAARFQREARSIAALQHPNIIQVYDYGEEGGQAYLVMQYVSDGVTLADVIAGGSGGAESPDGSRPLPPQRSVELLGRVLAGLGYAHEQGIVHRDVKPSNVLMASPAWPMLADFGIAKLLAQGDQRLTTAGTIIGTPAYMTPEQAFNLPVDARTDLYSAGVMLYEMVTGQVPFDAGTPVATLMQHAYEAPVPPRELNPALPEELEAVVLRALAKDPADRYQNAEEMRAALQALPSLAAEPDPDPDPQPEPEPELEAEAEAEPVPEAASVAEGASVAEAEGEQEQEQVQERERRRPAIGLLIAAVMLAVVATWGLARLTGNAPGATTHNDNPPGVVGSSGPPGANGSTPPGRAGSASPGGGVSSSSQSAGASTNAGGSTVASTEAKATTPPTTAAPPPTPGPTRTTKKTTTTGGLLTTLTLPITTPTLPLGADTNDGSG